MEWSRADGESSTSKQNIECLIWSMWLCSVSCSIICVSLWTTLASQDGNQTWKKLSCKEHTQREEKTNELQRKIANFQLPVAYELVIRWEILKRSLNEDKRTSSVDFAIICTDSSDEIYVHACHMSNKFSYFSKLFITKTLLSMKSFMTQVRQSF